MSTPRSLPPAGTRMALRDIDAFVEHAAEIVARGRDSYDEDIVLRLAAEALVIRIGEAASRIDAATATAHPDIPFHRARAMRNLIAHEYQRIDAALLWETLVRDLPALGAQARTLLGGDDSGDDDDTAARE